MVLNNTQKIDMTLNKATETKYAFIYIDVLIRVYSKGMCL